MAHYSRSHLLESARVFQKKVVSMWNKKAADLSELMTLGVSKFPDNTTKGTGMVNIEIARDIGILEGGDGGSRFVLGDNYDKRTVFIFGDAASISHFQGFIKEMWKEPAATLDSTTPDANTVRSALSSFDSFPANWHHGLNQLCEHYARFYGSFLQPIQIVLGISRMGIDPTKSYQLSYHLNHLVHNICQRILHDRFQSSGLCKDILFDLVSEDEYKK